MRRRQGLDTIFDLAEIGIKRHQRIAYPSGHLRQAQRNRPSSGNIPSTNAAGIPKPQATAHHHHWQNASQRIETKSKPSRYVTIVNRAVPKTAHRLKRGTIFMIGMGEQLDGFDIGDSINNLTSHCSAGSCARCRPPPDQRHKMPDHQKIGRQPAKQAGCEKKINGRQHQRSPDNGRQCKQNRMHHFNHHIGNCAGGLHFFLRNTSSKIIIKKPD